jgi:hypothetical protein
MRRWLRTSATSRVRIAWRNPIGLRERRRRPRPLAPPKFVVFTKQLARQQCIPRGGTLLVVIKIDMNHMAVAAQPLEFDKVVTVEPLKATQRRQPSVRMASLNSSSTPNW